MLRKKKHFAMHWVGLAIILACITSIFLLAAYSVFQFRELSLAQSDAFRLQNAWHVLEHNTEKLLTTGQLKKALDEWEVSIKNYNKANDAFLSSNALRHLVANNEVLASRVWEIDKLADFYNSRSKSIRRALNTYAARNGMGANESILEQFGRIMGKSDPDFSFEDLKLLINHIQYFTSASAGFSRSSLSNTVSVLSKAIEDQERKTIIIFLVGCIIIGAVTSLSLFKGQKALQESEENLHITLRSIGDGVIVTDLRGKIERMNPVAESLTEWKEEDAFSQGLMHVFHCYDSEFEDQQYNPVEAVINSRDVEKPPRETMLRSKSGREYRISESAAPIRTRQGKTVGAVLVFKDITREAELQSRLNQSQKLDAIGQLAGGVAHDFNNMLGGIISAAEILEDDIGGEEGANTYISVIIDAAVRASDLAKKLLSFSRLQKIASTPVDVHTSISRAIAILDKTIDKRIEITPSLEAEYATVIGDDTLLQNVFLNLGINASHAMAEGGDLSYSSKVVSLSEKYCSASPFNLEPGEYLDIDVRDTGCGIEPENLSKIFEPFFTTKGKDKGTGLGLSAAYGTIRQHGGAITAYSEVGRGTCFRILLPLAEQDAEIRRPIQTIVKGKGLVLLVDDERVMRVTGEALLKEFGYDVLVAENGAEALEVFKNNSKEIRGVILDMIMPVMNGRDCFYAMQDINAEVPIILSSGFSRPEDIKDLKENGLAGFIQKPFRGIELNQVLAKII